MVSTLHFSGATQASPRQQQQQWCARLAKRRVHITFIAAATLVIGSLVVGVRPHDLTNVYDVQSWAGGMLVIAGLAIRSWAAGTLHKHTEVTTVGPYALVRHPLYVGSMLMIAGFCILIGQGGFVWLIAGTFSLLFLAAVNHEERALAAQFGAAWTNYAAATPRFIPRRLTTGASAWSLQQWRRNREYQAVAATALGLLGLQLWQQF
jgi:protein-S-isoprenylcysteine O-methyltransferase Ste14